MSLVSTASLWTNDETPNKKRASTMTRKTVKAQPEAHDYYKIDDDQEERSNRVSEIINKMSSVSVENDGAKLADFTPPPQPIVHTKKEPVYKEEDAPITNLENPLQIPAPSFSNRSVNPYIVNNSSAIALGNYKQVYEAPKPYYASMGIGNDNKLLDKINYMIHLLENMESEKTANITEEFVLYTFTGIFIIFVLDTFTRNGKYVR